MQDSDMIENLHFSVRTYQCLKRAGINTLEQLWDAYRFGKLLSFRGFGKKSLLEVEEKLNEVM